MAKEEKPNDDMFSMLVPYSKVIGALGVLGILPTLPFTACLRIYGMFNELNAKEVLSLTTYETALMWCTSLAAFGIGLYVLTGGKVPENSSEASDE